VVLLAVISQSLGDTQVIKDESRTISVVQNQEGDLEIVPGKRLNSGTVVWAALTNNQTESGWFNLEISSSPNFPDQLQARAAGLAEGYLTRNTIHEYYKEFFANDLCKDSGRKEGEDSERKEGEVPFCEYMKQQIDENEAWLAERIKEEAADSPYWHMHSLFYAQIDGLTEGWMKKTEEQGDGSIPGDFDLKYGMRMINYIADVWDYVEKFKLDNKQKDTPKVPRPTCSVLVKYLADLEELYVGHNAWHEYRAMGYRFLKKYSLPYRVIPTSEERVKGHTMSMSSYAGSIFSIDDFVIISSGLLTTETSLFIYNTSIYEAAQPKGQVFEPARVMAANRLASDGEEWVGIASQFNSGTYNNQWMVIDYNKIGPQGLEEGAFWVMEQLPGRTWAEDQTQVLQSEGYWGSYNRAFYPEAFQLSGATDMVTEHGDWFSYGETPRAKIFARDQGNVKDEPSMIKLMRYNDFQNDPLGVVPGCPKPIPAASIANRCDLTLANSSCSWQPLDYMVGHQPYGALDMKFTTRQLARSGQFWAVCGPTHGAGMPPFSWLNTNLTDIPGYTPIKVFDFSPSVTQWSMENIQDSVIAVETPVITVL